MSPFRLFTWAHLGHYGRTRSNQRLCTTSSTSNPVGLFSNWYKPSDGLLKALRANSWPKTEALLLFFKPIRAFNQHSRPTRPGRPLWLASPSYPPTRLRFWHVSLMVRPELQRCHNRVRSLLSTKERESRLRQGYILNCT